MGEVFVLFAVGLLEFDIEDMVNVFVNEWVNKCSFVWGKGVFVGRFWF